MPPVWYFREMYARRAEAVARVKQHADALTEAEKPWAKHLSADERKLLLSLEDEW